MVDLDSVKPHICIPLDEGDIALIKSADAGDAEAQTDLALLFLAANKFKSAIFWLELAIKKDYANAMYYLSRCYIDGNGVAQDENMGLMWLSKAAVYGSVIAQGLMQAVRKKLTCLG
jgi:TPR repeat protein